MPKLTYFLLVLVAGTLILSVVRHPKPIPTASANQKNRDDYKVDILQRVRRLIQNGAN
jgi:hypothetical protein